jgi:hypothetical protein
VTSAHHPSPLAGRSLRAAVLWGVVVGLIQAAAPLGFWWLAPATVYGLSLVLIAAVYIGFAVADGRPRVIAVEAGSPPPSWWSPPRASPDRRGCWCSASPATGSRTSGSTAAILVMLLTVGVDFHH